MWGAGCGMMGVMMSQSAPTWASQRAAHLVGVAQHALVRIASACCTRPRGRVQLPPRVAGLRAGASFGTPRGPVPSSRLSASVDRDFDGRAWAGGVRVRATVSSWARQSGLERVADAARASFSSKDAGLR